MMTETNGAGPGHNSAGAVELTDAQEEALFRNHLGKVRALKAKQASVTADLRNAYKGAKADGWAKKRIDFALALENDEGNELLEERRVEAKIARWLQHPIGTQTDLFADPEPDRAPLAERSFNDGRRVGMEGGNPKPPDGTADPAEWQRGWHAGQDALKSSLPLTRVGAAEVKKNEKKARGRPKGSGGKKASNVVALPSAALPAGQRTVEALAEVGAKGDAVIKDGNAGTIGDQPATHKIVT